MAFLIWNHSTSGDLGAGIYSVVYDECQNGVFDAEDTFFANAFQVIMPVNIPDADPSIQALKSRSKALRDEYFEIFKSAIVIFTLYDFRSLLGASVKLEEFSSKRVFWITTEFRELG